MKLLYRSDDGRIILSRKTPVRKEEQTGVFMRRGKNEANQ